MTHGYHGKLVEISTNVAGFHPWKMLNLSMAPYRHGTLEQMASEWKNTQSALLDGRSVPARGLTPPTTPKQARLRQRLEDDATHHALADTALWEAWQDFVRNKFTGRLLGFTATTADKHISLARFTRTVNGLSVIAPGIAFVEGAEYETLGDEKRLHCHGVLQIGDLPPEYTPLLTADVQARLTAIGFAKVEEIRDRVLWVRYITKDVSRDLLGNRVITW